MTKSTIQKGRFTIQELEESPVKRKREVKKICRRFSDCQQLKISHQILNNHPLDDIHCDQMFRSEVYNANNKKFVDFDNIWTNLDTKIKGEFDNLIYKLPNTVDSAKQFEKQRGFKSDEEIMVKHKIEIKPIENLSESTIQDSHNELSHDMNFVISEKNLKSKVVLRVERADEVLINVSKGKKCLEISNPHLFEIVN